MAAGDQTDASNQTDAVNTRLAALEARIAALEEALRNSAIGPIDAAPKAEAPPPPKPSAATSEPEASAAFRPPVAPLAEAQACLAALFALAILPDAADAESEEQRFAEFLELIHSERKGTPILDTSLRQYGWRQIRRNAKIYLRDAADPSSFDIARRDPSELAPVHERVKLFVKAATRMPTPITLRRDSACGGAFRVESTSL